MATPSTTINESFSREKHQADLWRWWEIRVICYGLIFLAIGPAAATIATVFKVQFQKEKFSLRTQAGIVACGLLILVVAFVAALQIIAPSNLLMTGVLWWVVSVVGSPTWAVFMDILDKSMNQKKPKTMQETIEAEQRRLEEQNEQLSRNAQRKLEKDNRPVRGFINLGVFMKGDTFPEGSGIHRTNEWILFDEKLINQHMLVLGAPGAGKSQTILRLVAEILTAGERDVFVVDGKGDSDFALDIANLIYANRRTPVPIFRLGHAHMGAVYNAFNGSAMDIYNRLCKIIDVNEKTGDNAYYANVHRDLLQLICFAGDEPPRSFEQVRERLTKRWLRAAYRDSADELETIEGYDQKLFDGLLIYLRPLIREFSQVIDPMGFSLETAKHAVFSIRTQSVGDTAGRLVRFLIEDFKDYLGKRQTRPAVFIIDEFQAFGADNINGLLSLARSAELGVILATQDTAGLGDEKIKRLIMANTRTKFLMATDFPEDIASLAGTIYALEASVQHSQGDPTGMGSARLQHQFKIDMNEVAKLQAGEGFLIRQRHAAKVKVKSINKPERRREAEQRILKPQQQTEQPRQQERQKPQDHDSLLPE